MPIDVDVILKDAEIFKAPTLGPVSVEETFSVADSCDSRASKVVVSLLLLLELDEKVTFIRPDGPVLPSVYSYDDLQAFDGPWERLQELEIFWRRIPRRKTVDAK